MNRARLCLLIAAIVIAAALRPADALTLDNPTDRFLYATAVQSLKAGSLDQGYKLLLVLENRNPDDRELQVLLARTEVARKDIPAAIARLRHVADAHSDWPRPRIEQALAHAAAEDWGKAKAILIAELGRKPPKDVRRNLERMIRGLEDKQTFLARFSAGIVPDSNITGGSNASKVEFLGLPFTLNDDAKAQSGVRGDISIGGTVRTRWRDDARLEASIDAAHSQPLGDEGTPSSNVRVGLAARTRGPDSALVVGFAVRPFYFDNELTRVERSVFARPVRRIAGRHYAVGGLTLTDAEVYNSTARDFYQWEATVGPSLGFGETGRLRLAGTFGRRNAEDDVFSFLRRGVSVNIGAAPWNGWRLGLNGAITRDVYEDFNIPFGRRQEDLTTEAEFSVTRTGWVFFGVSPQLGVRWRETRSTIDLYDRDSVSVTVGLALPY